MKKKNSIGRFINTNKDANFAYRNKNWLKRKYSKDKKSVQELAKYCKVDDTTIRLYLRKFNIKIRPNYYRHLKNKQPYKDKKWLYQQYIVEKQSISHLAEESGCCLMTIHKWLNHYNIPRRNGSECRKGILNPRFKGWFISKEGYKYIYNPEQAKLHGRKTSKGNYIQEHILNMSKHIGRPISRTEVIHHKDGNRLNNNVNNLQLFVCVSEHTKYEQTINTFAKKILFGDLLKKPFLRKYLLKLFNKFINEQC